MLVTTVPCDLIAGKAAAQRYVMSRHHLLELLGGRKLWFWKFLMALFKGGERLIRDLPTGPGHPSLRPQCSLQGRTLSPSSQMFVELIAIESIVWSHVDCMLLHKKMKSMHAEGRTLGLNPDSITVCWMTLGMFYNDPVPQFPPL